MTFITICNLAENKEALWTLLLESFATLHHKSEKKNTMMRVFIGTVKDVEAAIDLLREKSSEFTEGSVRYYVTDLESVDIIRHYLKRKETEHPSDKFELACVENTKKSLASKGITNFDEYSRLSVKLYPLHAEGCVERTHIGGGKWKRCDAKVERTVAHFSDDELSERFLPACGPFQLCSEHNTPKRIAEYCSARDAATKTKGNMLRVARLAKHRYWVMEYPDCDLYSDVPQIVDGFDSVEDERAKGKKIRTVLESGFYSGNVIDGHAVLIYDSVENKPLITGPEHRVTYEELSDEHEDEQWTDSWQIDWGARQHPPKI